MKKFTFEDYRKALEDVGPKAKKYILAQAERELPEFSDCVSWPTRALSEMAGGCMMEYTKKLPGCSNIQAATSRACAEEPKQSYYTRFPAKIKPQFGQGRRCPPRVWMGTRIDHDWNRLADLLAVPFD